MFKKIIVTLGFVGIATIFFDGKPTDDFTYAQYAQERVGQIDLHLKSLEADIRQLEDKKSSLMLQASDYVGTQEQATIGQQLFDQYQKIHKQCELQKKEHAYLAPVVNQRKIELYRKLQSDEWFKLAKEYCMFERKPAPPKETIRFLGQQEQKLHELVKIEQEIKKIDANYDNGFSSQLFGTIKLRKQYREELVNSGQQDGHVTYN